MDKKYTTDKKHFQIFKSECEYWIKTFGLFDWDINIRHVEMEPLGNCNWHAVDRWAIISLAKNFGETEPTDLELRATAYHEVFELMLGRLHTLATYRYINASELDSEKHTIIYRMINCHFKPYYEENHGK